MSKYHVEISSSVSELVSFIKEKTVSNLVESSQSGILQEIERNDIEKIIAIVNNSVTQAFSLGYTNVESAVSKVLAEHKKD